MRHNEGAGTFPHSILDRTRAHAAVAPPAETALSAFGIVVVYLLYCITNHYVSSQISLRQSRAFRCHSWHYFSHPSGLLVSVYLRNRTSRHLQVMAGRSGRAAESRSARQGRTHNKRQFERIFEAAPHHDRHCVLNLTHFSCVSPLHASSMRGQECD